MQGTASWLLSLTAASSLLIDGISIHPLVDHAIVDPELDVIGRLDARAVRVLALTALGPGRFIATVTNPSERPLLLFQGEELPYDGDPLELAVPRLVPPEGVVPVEVRRRRPGSAPLELVEARLQRLDAFAPPAGTVGYLAILGRDLARLELFPGPLTCRSRWWWALGSVVGLADGCEAPAHAEAIAASMIRRLAAACRSGSWRQEAWAVQRVQVSSWPSLIGRAITSGQQPVYLDLAQLPGSLRVRAVEPVPRPALAATAPLALAPVNLIADLHSERVEINNRITALSGRFCHSTPPPAPNRSPC